MPPSGQSFARHPIPHHARNRPCALAQGPGTPWDSRAAPVVRAAGRLPQRHGSRFRDARRVSAPCVRPARRNLVRPAAFGTGNARPLAAAGYPGPPLLPRRRASDGVDRSVGLSGLGRPHQPVCPSGSGNGHGESKLLPCPRRRRMAVVRPFPGPSHHAPVVHRAVLHNPVGHLSLCPAVSDSFPGPAGHSPVRIRAAVCVYRGRRQQRQPDDRGSRSPDLASCGMDAVRRRSPPHPGPTGRGSSGVVAGRLARHCAGGQTERPGADRHGPAGLGLGCLAAAATAGLSSTRVGGWRFPLRWRPAGGTCAT